MTAMNALKSKLKSLTLKLYDYLKKYISIIKRPFKSYKNTLISLISIYFVLILTIFIICSIRGGFFTLNTDDIIQYYPFMEGFINKLKHFEFSFYNNSFFMGTSAFASTYYIPLDIFTFLTFIISFIMPTDRAYGLVNLLKIMSGGLLMSYFLKTKGFKNKTVFLYSLIYSFGGILATECVFPVYWSLLFYIPLGVIVIDKYTKNHKYFFFIPLYTLAIIFYDFYIAYMLLAFIMIYLLIEKLSMENHHLFGKKSILKKKSLYFDLFTSLGLILIGLLMSMVIFLPSYLYISNKTTRVSVKEAIWKYAPSHYLTVISTYFITSNPINILLSHGDYLRNHCSMFITLLGLYYLVLFFFTKGYKNNIQKIFILILNLIMGIPLVSMIMTGTNQGYIRWFFIVYFFNFYCSAQAFEYYDNKVTGIIKRVCVLALFSFGIGFISYLFFKSDSFTTYNSSPFKFIILIFFYIFTGLYIIALFLPHQNKVTYVLAILEVICSGMMVIVNVDNSYSYYEYCEDQFNKIEINLKNKTSYTESNAYRAAILTNESNYFVNVSAIHSKFNTNQFFHSFYDATSNPVYNSILDTKSPYWSRRETYMSSGPFALIDGVKYGVISKSKCVELPSCYELKFQDELYSYYELKGLKPFMLYDSINQYKSYNRLKMALYLINSGYLYTENDDQFTEIVKHYNFKILNDDSKLFENKFSSITLSGHIEHLDNVKYAVYSLNQAMVNRFVGNDYLYVPGYESERNTGYNDSFILDTDNNKHYSFYGLTSNTTEYIPSRLYVKIDSDYIPNISFYSFNMNEIMDIYNSLNDFTNEEFILKGSKMTIKLDYNSKDYDRILKTNFTYSSEWKVNNANFKTINIDGGYLGIVIPANSTSCDIKLKFEPDGLKFGSQISAFTISCFFTSCLAIYINLKPYKKEYLA